MKFLVSNGQVIGIERETPDGEPTCEEQIEITVDDAILFGQLSEMEPWDWPFDEDSLMAS